MNQSLPADLNPGGEREFLLPSRRLVTLREAHPAFARWSGAPVTEDYGSTDLVSLAGAPTSPVLAVLRILQGAGWQGVWIDPVGHIFREDHRAAPPVLELPSAARQVLDRIQQASRSRKGVWDLLAWHDEHVLFALVLRKDRDRVRSHRLSWLETALTQGLTPESFAIIEWS
jgi:hypothetical protein